MKFKIKNFNEYYYLGLENRFIVDKYIANYLGMTKNEYQNILRSCGAIKFIDKVDCYFKTREDAKKAIEELEPLLIMANLIN